MAVETLTIDVPDETQLTPKKSNSGATSEFKQSQRRYSFKDEQVVQLFYMLIKSNKLKLPEPIRPADVGCTNEPNYCLYHRMVHHPTQKCYTLKGIIQSLMEARVVSLKTETKKVTANMVSLQFGELPETIIQDGVIPIPAAEMKIV